ncbi:MAG: DUF998 domain-containing protein [Candidatus Jordarchaeum sp.]|uniref:DUF998 domain-containing protein n=1 Tax=Candidatus Jordarchaeum sp. TaxID=2823881 RepID=UPI00404A5E26
MKSTKTGANSNFILIGGLFAVISMIVGIIGVLGAVVTYTGFPFRALPVRWLPYPIPVINTGFSMWYQFVSELGIGPSAFLFNVGLILAGILALPVFPGILGLFRGSIIAKIGVVLGLTASLALVGVGLAPMVMSQLHGTFAMIFFISVGIAIILLSFEMYRGEFFSKAIAIYGVIFVIVDLAFLIQKGALLEWGVFFIIVTWILAVGIQVILKRKEM